MTEGRDGLGDFTRSPGFKFFLIGALVFLLSVPLLFVYFLVYERSQRSSEVAAQIAQEWGGPQTLRGPFLIVPYSVKVVTLQKDREVETLQERRAVFLPESLSIAGDSRSEQRRRSIFDVTVFTAGLKIEGRFAAPDVLQTDPEAVSIRWRDAILAFAISDVSGLKDAASLAIAGGRSVAFEPSMGFNSPLTGIHARLADPTAGDQPLGAFGFAFALNFNGSSDLKFAPVARETVVSLTSDWGHPSFSGAFLPIERTVSADGFSASWRVPHLARSVPQSWVDAGGYAGGDRFDPYLFGVRFYVPIDYYDLVTRAAKYGLMFLAVAFGAIFVLELRSPYRVHAVQYIFVGVAMVFFYVLLLSLSEHIGFLPAYVAAAAATGAMLSVYAGMALRSAAKGVVMLTVFLLLYGLLYLILRLEDYALLTGAVAGFILLTVAMFVTLRINWSSSETAAYRQ